MDPRRLRPLIRRKLDNGTLPTADPVHVEVSRGTDAICDGCGDWIGPFDIEHRFTYVSGRPTFRLHFDCAAEWMAFRRERREGGVDRAS